MGLSEENVAHIPSNTRWLRVSLRSLLIAFTLSAIAIACFAHWAQQRRAAFAAIRAIGGIIRMRADGPSYLEHLFGSELFGNVVKVDLRKCKADNALLAKISFLKELTELDLSSADINDEGLRQIGQLPLRELWVQDTHVTDASASTISRIKTLDFLQLNATRVSDVFLENLDALPKLKNLGLRGTRVTGVGMKYLLRHRNLSVLDVYDTTVDDAGVAAVADCQALTNLGLSMTRVSNEVFAYLDKLPNLIAVDLSANREVTTQQVREFEKLHPRCKVEWYGN